MAKDIIHDAVKNALINDGWEITDDPLTLEYADANVFVDLGAERLLAAQRGTEKIAVEIKSFVGRSNIRELMLAIGQYMTYRSFLKVIDPERKLLVAISNEVYETVFMRRESIQLVVDDTQLPLITVDLEREEIVRWTS